MAKNLLPGSVRVEDVISSPLITVSEEMPPVTNENGKVTGIVTILDLLGVTNEIMTELLVINSQYDRDGVCGAISADLMPVDGVLVCPNCREQEWI